EVSLRVADQLDCPRLNIHGTGLDGKGLPVDPVSTEDHRHWDCAVQTLSQLARLGENEGRVFTLENLNTRVDHPGATYAKSETTQRLVEAVGSPGLRMNLDLYHAQVDEGNLIERMQKALPF